MDSNECPANPEEVAESYVMGTLQKEQAVAFEDHYVTCSQCATVLQKTAEYVAAMRAVSEKVPSEPPTSMKWLGLACRQTHPSSRHRTSYESVLHPLG